MNETYKPQPIDTGNVVLPEELVTLVEDIARNVHEVWAQGRLTEGWTYGRQRSDVEKQHPGLVPYEELSESEKEYDRSTAMQTIKLILKLGFKISK